MFQFFLRDLHLNLLLPGRPKGMQTPLEKLGVVCLKSILPTLLDARGFEQLLVQWYCIILVLGLELFDEGRKRNIAKDALAKYKTVNNGFASNVCPPSRQWNDGK